MKFLCNESLRRNLAYLGPSKARECCSADSVSFHNIIKADVLTSLLPRVSCGPGWVQLARCLAPSYTLAAFFKTGGWYLRASEAVIAVDSTAVGKDVVDCCANVSDLGMSVDIME